MSGHSKWHNRIHRKSRQDAKRGAIFSKMGKEILIAARAGGGDPVANPRLKLAIERAREAGVPAENIRRAIERGTGADDGTRYEELTYEGYGPGGLAVLVEIQTDNRNRTAGEIRHIFARNGGNLGEAGCVAWMFEKKGILVLDRGESGLTEESALELALEAGAEDVRADDPETLEIVTAPEDFEAVCERVRARGLHPAVAELTMLPRSTVELSGKDAAQAAHLVSLLEEHDDVSNVYVNAELDDVEALAE
jgi:YebC/PmpR family DNA-binding regulatory protein